MPGWLFLVVIAGMANFWLRFLGWLFLIEASGVFLLMLFDPIGLALCCRALPCLVFLACLVMFCLAVYRLVLISQSCRVVSCLVQLFFLNLHCVAFGVVIFSCGSSSGHFWLWLLRWPFLIMAMGCSFWLATFPYFGLGFI